jgi:hypothetical protein
MAMTKSSSIATAVLAGGLALAACGGGARDVDYRPSRGISADIAATHATGSTAFMKGRTVEVEPLGDMPWLSDQRHQGGP